MAPVQASILAIITSIVGIVVGFGVLSNVTAGIIVSAASTLIPAVFVVVNSLENAAKVKAGVKK